MSDLDLACARALGWTCADELDGAHVAPVWRDAAGNRMAFPPTTRELLDEVERQRLRHEYITELRAEAIPYNDVSNEGALWELLTADAEQHARAFLAALNYQGPQ
jgi:hypothetical protein